MAPSRCTLQQTGCEELAVQMRKRWWLGFVALIGFYKVPDIVLAWHGRESGWAFLSLGWFLWLLYFVPKVRRDP